MGTEGREEKLAGMATEYMNQDWQHTRSKIVREMRTAGFDSIEIVDALIAVARRVKGATKLRELIEQAIAEQNPRKAKESAEIMRIHKGMDYQQSYDFVNSVAPIHEADWDALLSESEEDSSDGEKEKEGQ